jgi:hypothetical protein
MVQTSTNYGNGYIRLKYLDILDDFYSVIIQFHYIRSLF